MDWLSPEDHVYHGLADGRTDSMNTSYQKSTLPAQSKNQGLPETKQRSNITHSELQASAIDSVVQLALAV